MDDGVSRHEKTFFAVAKDLSLLSNHKQKLGCVIVDKHHIVGSGHNSQTKCHRFQADLDKKFFGVDNCKGPIHAEVDALIPLIKRRYDLTGATLYVYRQNKDGHEALARPCERCMSLIKSCGIRKIKYTTPDGIAFEKIIY